MKAITLIFLALALVASGCKPKQETPKSSLEQITWGKERG